MHPVPCYPTPQAEVEQFYIRSGHLIPNYHKVYWMGLTANTSTWPKFTWLDRAQPRRTGRQHMHA